MAAAGDLRPKRRVREALESSDSGAAGHDVLVEAKLATRPDHSVQLGESPILLWNGAQNQGYHARVERFVVAGQRVGDRVDHLDLDTSVGARLEGTSTQVVLRLYRDDLLDRPGIVREGRSVAGADLDHPSAEALEEGFAMLAGTASFTLGGNALVKAREERMMDLSAIFDRHPTHCSR